MPGDVLYQVLKNFLDISIWGGELAGAENLSGRGPAVFVSNHALALGPIAVVASLPVRLYPWAIGDMMDWSKAAAYLKMDFVEPQLHIPSPFSLPAARLISQASVRLLMGIGAIPVWHGDELLETFRLSVESLQRGRSLLIFPEDPAQPPEPQCGMRPFQKGFARLGEMYFEGSGQILPYYPIAVHPGLRLVKLGKPIPFNPHNNRANERIRIRSVMESMIRSMYLELTPQSYAGIPLPH